MRDWFSGLALDARFAARRLRRDRAVTAAAALCLGLGLASIFSVARITDTLWFGTPPGVRQARLLRRLVVWRPAEQGGYLPFLGYPLVAELMARVPPGIEIAALHELDVSVRHQAEVRLARAGLVTENFLEVLRVPLAAGRGLEAPDAESPGVVTSHRFAMRYFGSPRLAVGQTLVIGARAYTVSGVLPPGFAGTELLPVDVWLPLHGAASEYLPPNWQTEALLRAFKVFVRLSHPGAQRELETLAAAVYRDQTGPSLTSPVPARAVASPLQLGRTPWGSEDADRSGALALLSGLLWLIVCANFGGLVLARAVTRQPESMLTLALGAPPRRVLRVWALEIAALTLAGAAIGLSLGLEVYTLLLHVGLIPQSETYRSSLWHIASAIAVSVALAIATGLYLAHRQAARLRIATALGASSRATLPRRSRLQSGLLGAQVALSVALLYVAALFARSFAKAKNVGLGFVPDGLYVISPAGGGLQLSVRETDRLFREIAARARSEPGVLRSSVAVTVPFVANFGVWAYLPGQEDRRTIPFVDLVTPGYFETLGIPLLQGRDVDPTLDSPSATPSVILSRRVARELIGEAEAVGHCVVVAQPPCRSVIGIVGDVQQADLRTPVSHVYLPLDQNPDFLPIRAALVRFLKDDPDAISRLLPKLQGLTPHVALQVRPMTEIVAQQLRPWRLSAAVLSTFSLIALGVMTLGVFGVVSYRTSRRAAEMGLRIALGAAPARVAASVPARAVLWVGAGAVAGVLGGNALGHLVGRQLFSVSATDPMSALLSLLLAAGAALVASLYPALHAARTDPARALRTE